MPSFSLLKKFFGQTISEAAGFAAGSAVADTLRPELQIVSNEAWSVNTTKPPGAEILAQGVAQGQVDPTVAYKWATETGFGKAQMDALVSIANVGPPLASALTLWRRGVWLPEQYQTALNRMGIEPEWYAGLKTLKDEWLTPAELAVMVQRGIVANDNLLPVGPPTAVGKVPPMPSISIDPIAEAAGAGLSAERLAGLARIIGLPASPDLAARMTFRGIIDRVDFDRAISEGNTRNEWAPFLFDGFRQILTAHDWVELHLRGYIDQPAMYAGTSLHGMSQADTDHLFAVLGRPLAVKQITTALARGAKFNPIPGELTDPYEASVHEANLKPSYYEMAIANKFTYPSLFQLNNLVKSGAITPDIAKDWATKNGLAPEVVAAMFTYWQSVGKTGASTVAKTSTTKAANAVQKAYVQANLTQADAEAELTKLGEDATTYPGLFTIWDVSRTAYLQGLTNLQIRNRYRNLSLTLAEATALLVERGLTATEANTYLTYAASGQPPVA